MSKMTEVEIQKHVAYCKKDACKLLSCEEKDLHVSVKANDNVVVRLKNAVVKDRREK